MPVREPIKRKLTKDVLRKDNKVEIKTKDKIHNLRKLELLMDAKRDQIRKEYLSNLRANETEFLHAVENHNFKKSAGFQITIGKYVYATSLDSAPNTLRVVLMDLKVIDKYGFIIKPLLAVHDQRGNMRQVYDVNRTIHLTRYNLRTLEEIK